MKKFTMEQVLECIEDTGGIISTIADELKKVKGSNGKCSWSTAKKYIEMWPETKKAYEDELERFLDVAESTVMTAMMNDDVAAAKFVLATKGKHRGYTKEVIIKSVDDFSDLPDDVKSWKLEDFAKVTFLGLKGMNDVGESSTDDLEDEVFEAGGS